MEFRTTLLLRQTVTHDVQRFIVERPDGFRFEPGQGVELAVDAPGWEEEGRPFTPTSLPEDGVLEFTIKAYPEHAGVTDRLHRLAPGAALHMSAPFGTIRYRGPGVFIAAGAGITPFLAILRRLAREGRLEGHSLLFSNKTPEDIIDAQELRAYLGARCHFTCTRGAAPGYDHRRIDRDYLAEHVTDTGQAFYVCGPPGFTEATIAALKALGARPEAVVFEE